MLSWNGSIYLFHMECLLNTQRKGPCQERVSGARICVTKVKLKVGVDADEHIQNRARTHSFQQT